MVKNNQFHCLPLEKINPNLRSMKSTILGPVDMRAKEIQAEISKGAKKPFKTLINASLGDAQAMGQNHMTFLRQILALVSLPDLMNDSSYPEDLKKRAKEILNACRNQTVGSYTHCFGLEIARRHVAEYIYKRDGIPCDWNNIMITNGASEAIKQTLRLISPEENGKKSGILVPIPQYPIYAAAITDFGLAQVNYYLDEDHNWGLNITELKRAIDEAKTYCNPRALVIINPGNPTGQTEDGRIVKETYPDASMAVAGYTQGRTGVWWCQNQIDPVLKTEEITTSQETWDILYVPTRSSVCLVERTLKKSLSSHEEKLLILADEVYQLNVYGEGNKFYSFKKVMTELHAPYSDMELASFMSGSKGYLGECGIRGGYAELLNMHPEVWTALNKTTLSYLCPNVYGQILVDCVARQPINGEASYKTYIREKEDILNSLEYKALLVTKMFNSFRGMKCNPIQGAMYAFPQIHLPSGALEAAKQAGQSPDVFYAFQLLEKYGICVVPGFAFDQKPGTYHFRITILPQTDVLKEMLEKIGKFHADFTAEYS